MIEWWLTAPNRLNTTTRKTGPTTIRLRYSLTRRMKERGCSTCQAKLKALLELLDRGYDGIEQEGKADRAEHVAAHVFDEGHHLCRQLAGALADRSQELEYQRLEVAVHAKSFQHGECEGDERHEREQRRVDEAHGPQVQFAGEQIADQREGVAHRVEQPVSGFHREVWRSNSSRSSRWRMSARRIIGRAWHRAFAAANGRDFAC